MERESVKKKSCHPPCVPVWSVSKHKPYLSMDPIFDFVTGVMQVCAFILPTKLHLSHLTSREERASSGEDTHLSDIERSNKKGKAMNNLFCAKLQKSQTCSKIWKVLGSGCSNHQQYKTVRKKFKGSQASNFYAACLIKKRSSLP